MRTYAVITAGGNASPELAHAIGRPEKALAPLGTRRLIDPAIDAARAFGVAGIALVADAAVVGYCADRVDRVVPAAIDGVENIRRALQIFPEADRLLYLTCDLPFIDAAALRHFVERAGDAAVAMALASADIYDAEFPGAPPHAVAFGNERIANGSVFLIDRSAIPRVTAVAGRFFRARKSLPRLALLLGPALCLHYLRRQLTIADVERRACSMLGVDARAVRDAAPGLCYDVDDVADWAYAHSLALARA